MIPSLILVGKGYVVRFRWLRASELFMVMDEWFMFKKLRVYTLLVELLCIESVRG